MAKEQPTPRDMVEFSAKPAAPAAGRLRFYAKTDDLLYVQKSDGTETQVGAGGSSSGSKSFAFFAA